MEGQKQLSLAESLEKIAQRAELQGGGGEASALQLAASPAVEDETLVVDDMDEDADVPKGMSSFDKEMESLNDLKTMYALTDFTGGEATPPAVGAEPASADEGATVSSMADGMTTTESLGGGLLFGSSSLHQVQHGMRSAELAVDIQISGQVAVQDLQQSSDSALQDHRPLPE